MKYPDTRHSPKEVEFKGVTYQLVSKNRYYISKSTTNKGRKGAKSLHVVIFEDCYNEKVLKGFCVHHRDHNHLNNNPENLQLMTIPEHARYHGKKRAEDPEWRKENEKHLEKIRPLTKAWHSSEEGIEWHRQHGRNVFANRKHVEKECACGKDFETKTYHQKACCDPCKQRQYLRTRRNESLDKLVRCTYLKCKF